MRKAFVGWRDVPADLSDGAALARLDAALPRPALLVSSDLVRASATADMLAAGRDRLAHAPASGSSISETGTGCISPRSRRATRC